MRHWTWCDIDLRILILTSASPESISVFSGRYHIMSNASIIISHLALIMRKSVFGASDTQPAQLPSLVRILKFCMDLVWLLYFPGTQKNRLDERWDKSFENPKHMFKLMDKKIIVTNFLYLTGPMLHVIVFFLLNKCLSYSYTHWDWLLEHNNVL